MENKGPEAGDDKDCADEEKDRYKNFPIHIGRVMIISTTVAGIGLREMQLRRVQEESHSTIYILSMSSIQLPTILKLSDGYLQKNAAIA
jgi:hypothetical protein